MVGSLSLLRTSSSEPHNERGEVILKSPKVGGDNWNLGSITQTKAQHSHFLCPMTFKCINGYNFTSSWRARMDKKNQKKEWRITSAWQKIKHLQNSKCVVFPTFHILALKEYIVFSQYQSTFIQYLSVFKIVVIKYLWFWWNWRQYKLS